MKRKQSSNKESENNKPPKDLNLWNEHALKIDENLTVITVGSIQDIYKYECTVNQKALHHHYTYNSLSRVIEEGNELLKTLNKSLAETSERENESCELFSETVKYMRQICNKITDAWQSKPENFLLASEIKAMYPRLTDLLPPVTDKIDAIFKDLKNTPEQTLKACIQEFNNIDLWRKASSRNAVLAKYLYRATFKMYNKPDALPFYRTMSLVEHNRWWRFHMTDGWLYDKKETAIKRHNCLCPFFMLPIPKKLSGQNDPTNTENVLFYDTMNVIWAIASDKDEKDEKEN